MTQKIIDTHVHIFDTRLVRGIPWPSEENELLYQTTLPEQIKKVSLNSGVNAAVVVECSPRYEDNLWVLDKIQADKFIKGFVGFIDPADTDFSCLLEKLNRFHVFKGIRYGNLWGRDLGEGLDNPLFIRNLKRLPQEGLVMDTANPDMKLLTHVLRLSDIIPELTIIIDHLPSLDRPTNQRQRKDYDRLLLLLSERPNIYVKISAVLRSRAEDKHVPGELSHYLDRLNNIYDLFGPERLLYGSDWPNSKPLGSYSQILQIVKEFFQTKSPEIEEKYFRNNAIKVYNIKE